jgi:hypothetical protein
MWSQLLVQLCARSRRLACWPLVPEFAGSNPAEFFGFFSVHEKILSMPSFGGEVK